ncbi:unnamed protein product [Clavelina lepadiformis]|uniref:Uncharacterized protein n=1 Tax=Clavelina lepadiformis TaxID=159417 RepID=A0ABP0FS50_CLALP
MSEAGLNLVQSWLSTELEHRGIDAVIYTRHVLDLLLNSKHTMDLHLAEKEASIFASLPPGSNKRKPKQKYKKRSHSFTFLDEVALKKEMAANFLHSAVDDYDDSIETLIDSLYVKLNTLHLISDPTENGSSSDEGLVGKKLERRHENYQDAFPLLHNKHDSHSKTNNVTSVWNGSNKFGNKIEHVDVPESNKSLQKQDENHPRVTLINKHKKKQISSEESNRNVIVKDSGTKKKASRGASGRWRRTGSVSTVSPTRAKWRNNRCKKQCVEDRREFDKENANERRRPHDHKHERNKRKLGSSNNHSRSFMSNVGATVPNESTLQNFAEFSYFSNPSNNKWKKRSMTPKVDENEISHLYSAGIQEIFSNKTQLPRSKWFRDPESGCLEFEPAYKNQQSSETSPVSDKVFEDKDTSESWLWCPSPSLWEDDDGLSPGSAVSRLETMYRPSAKSDPDITGQLMKDYQDIFADVSNLPPQVDNDHDDLTIGNSLGDAHFLPPLDFTEEDVDQSCNEVYSSSTPTKESVNGFDIWPYSASMSSNNVQNNSGVQSLLFSEPYCMGDVAAINKTPVSSNETVNNEIESLLNCDDELACANVVESRKSIWLQHASESSVEAEIHRILRGCKLSPQPTAEAKKNLNVFEKLHFNSNYLTDPVDNFLDEFSLKVFDSNYLHWMINLGTPNQVCSGRETMNSLLKYDKNFNPASDLNDEEAFYSAELVQRVVDVVTFTEDHGFEQDVIQNFLKSNRSMLSPYKMSFNEIPTASTCPSFSSYQESPYYLKPSANNTSLLADSITENEAWKTSLRIGNIWQTISGIRPVDIVYSEKQEADKPAPQPSSLTHFRPIHANEHDSDLSQDSDVHGHYSSDIAESYTPVTDEYSECKAISPVNKTNDVSGRCDMWGLEREIGRLLYDEAAAAAAEECKINFPAKFEKHGEDKSMQTTFEQQILRNDTDMCKSLAVRPPKANSR